MDPLRRRSPGRTAMVLTFIALLATVCVGVYLFFVRRLPNIAPRLASGELSREAVKAELSVLLLITLASILLILVFVMGAYLLIRAGRAVSQKRVGGEPTEYVDAWSRYRLSEEQIEAATEEEPSDSNDQATGEDYPPKPPSDDPEDPDPAS